MHLTGEADLLPTNAKELLHDYGSVGCHSSKSNDLSVHARIASFGYIRLLWESDVGNRNEQSMKSNLAERQIEQLKHRTSFRLNNFLTIWSLLR